jgi:DNA-binding SARP family transcriptional activator/streptogramin lyase
VLQGAVEYLILGPLEVSDYGQAVALAAAKLRVLLGVFLLHPGEVLSRERLIDELWGDSPPKTAAKVLQMYVSQLRKALGKDSIATHTRGYLMRVEPDELDASRFRQLLAEARALVDEAPADATAKFGDALALWRGPVLVGIEFESFARNERERLEELRLAAIEERIDCELALGRHRESLVDLEPIVAAYPLRERPRAQLMLALYGSGRQAEALAVYREGRQLLVDELGLEPSDELKLLERRILDHDPTLLPGRPADEDGAPLHARRIRRRALLAAAALAAIAAALVLGLASGGRSAVAVVPNSVAEIDLKTNRVVSDTDVGNGPSLIIAGHEGLWISAFGDAIVQRIDERTHRVVRTIATAPRATGLTYAFGSVWAAVPWAHKLLRIDPRVNDVVSTVPLHCSCTYSVLAAGDHAVWELDEHAILTRIDPARNAVDQSWGRSLAYAAGLGYGLIAYGRGSIWTATGDATAPSPNSTLFRVDPDVPRVHNNVPLAELPYGLVFAYGSIWVSSGNRLLRYEPSSMTLSAAIPLGASALGIAAGGGSIWVAGGRSGIVTRIDPADNRVIARILVGHSTDEIAVDDHGAWINVNA